MKRLVLVLLALLAVGAGIYWRLRQRPSAKLPGFFAWVEPSKDPKAPGLQVYPLGRLDTWDDISVDPDEEKTSWEQLPRDRFPLAAKPALEAWHMGQRLGSLKVLRLGAEQVACSQLILGRASWAGKAPDKAPEGFIALYGARPQSDWRATLEIPMRHTLEAAFLDEARKALSLPADAAPESQAWSWFRLPDGQGALGSLAFKSGDKRVTWNALFRVANGTPQLIWSEAGTGGASDDAMDSSTIELLDVADLDGDGVPDLLIRRSGDQSFDFEVLRIQGGRVEVVYQGSGYGC